MTLLPQPTAGKKLTSSFLAVFSQCCSILLVSLISYSTYGQSSQLSDYVILGGDPSCAGSNNCGVIIGPQNQIGSGLIGSLDDIVMKSGSQHGGSLYALRTLDIKATNNVDGDIYASNSTNLSGTIFEAAKAFTVQGNLFINGSIDIDGGAVNGQVTRPASASYNGPTPAGGEVIATPSINALPAFPPITNIPPAGIVDVNNTGAIIPGAYRDLSLGGGKTLTFSGTGDYIFDHIYNSGSFNTFIVDFQNDPSGKVRFLVHNDVNVGKLKFEIINGGDASRIYLETHDNTNGRAFRIIGANFGNGEVSCWFGTVYAPFESIVVGNYTQPVRIKGALFSPHEIELRSKVEITHVPYSNCNGASFNVQIDPADSILCDDQVILNANVTPGGNYSWTTNSGNIVSGANGLTPTVDQPGYYVLSVTGGGCSAVDSVLVYRRSCIEPYYPAPVTGKSNNKLGSELTQLAANNNFQDTGQIVFQINRDSVLIEIIAIEGRYQNLLALLQTPAYGLTNLIDNGLNSLIISGLFPIQNLPKLDSLPNDINYVRPLFPAIINTGLILSQGDGVMHAPFVRGGFGVAGEGVKVGVLSDSYNRLAGNPAQIDISNEDLPGTGNGKNSTPINIIKDYPFSGGTDEGRAMLQIIHDVAPAAELAFRTGYISAGDFAQGILDLAADSCDIIVDDITYITEPFLSDGVVSQAINKVTSEGVSYFSSAGNFGDNAYGSTFSAAPAPAGIVGSAHDFGGGDIFQSVSLQPGNYLMVLQWQDSIYSIGQTSTGTNNDLDFYLTDDAGNTLFGFNRNNLGGDPLEIMPFTVRQASQSNILIVRSAGTDNIPFKLVIFRGDLSFNEFNTGTSTIVGHANSEGAMAVGAVGYESTPDFGVDPPILRSYSSEGGTPVGGVIRNKPDFVGPDGVNTSVALGAGDPEGDGAPNFFGTSAAAPHAAGVAALIKSARLKFENAVTSPEEMRSIMSLSAIDMETPGFDLKSGAGFIQADLSLITIASPNPVVYSITLLDTNKTPGIDTVTIRIEGDFFTGETKILVRNDTVTSSTTSSSSIDAEIPPFTGNPPLSAFNTPKSSSGIDGGGSLDSIFFNMVVKQKVQVVVDNQTKFYSETNPNLTFQVLIDSVHIDSTGLSLTDLGLDNMNIFSTAGDLSNVGTYLIRAEQRTLDLSNSVDAGINDLYTWEFYDAQLRVEKMPLTITIRDTSIEYGQLISSFDFVYDYPDSLINLALRSNVQDSISVNHQANIANALMVVNEKAEGVYRAAGRALVNGEDVKRLTYMASGRALVNARPVFNPYSLTNGLPDTTYVVDVSAESVFDYGDGPDSVTVSNAFKADGASRGTVYQASGRALVNALDFAKGEASVSAINESGVRYQASGRALVNAYPLVNAKVRPDGVYQAAGRALVNNFPIVNGQPTNVDSSDIVLILDEADVDTTLTDSIFPFTPINVVLGYEVGNRPTVPAPFFNPNYNISYRLGVLTITPATLNVQADSVKVTYGDSVIYNYTTEGYLYADADSTVIKGPPTYSLLDSSGSAVTTANLHAGNYTIVPDNLDLGDTTNYQAQYGNGYLQVCPAKLKLSADSVLAQYGDAIQVSLQIEGFKYADSVGNAILSGPDIRLVNDSADYSLPGAQVDAGEYQVMLSNLTLAYPNNYTLCYDTGYAEITKADLSVTAGDTMKSQGAGNPVFRLIYSGFRYNDGPSDITPPAASSLADASSVAGFYDISLSGGSARNYNLMLNKGTLTVTGLQMLTVTADTLGVRAGSAVSTFTYQLDGSLNPGDVVTSPPSFAVSPSNYYYPGVYDIIPSNLGVTNASSYQINYENGKLYVNPYGFWAFPIRIGYVCVEPVANHPSGFNWKVTYFYKNYNSTPLYIPESNYNSISGGAYSGSLPEIFEPGIGFVEIYFDGSPIKWKVSSYALFSRRWRSRTVSSYSRQCPSYAKSASTPNDQIADQGKSAGKSLADDLEAELLSFDEPDIFPNPTTGLVYLLPAEGKLIDEYSLVVMDATGRVLREKINNTPEGELMRIDLSNLSSGMYLIQVTDSEKSYYFRITKDL